MIFATPRWDPLGGEGYVTELFWDASVHAAIGYDPVHPKTKQCNPFTP
jgi:hypothetical protein